MSYTFASTLENAEKGTQIVLVSLGIDGISCNEPGWNALVKKFQHGKGLKMILLIAEDQSQWHQAKTMWSHHDWLGPIEGRLWACCDLKELLDPASHVRLYTQILDQWRKCGGGRAARGQAIESEERPVVGRNGKKCARK